jgi:hypothetical protein
MLIPIGMEPVRPAWWSGALSQQSDVHVSADRAEDLLRPNDETTDCFSSLAKAAEVS